MNRVQAGVLALAILLVAGPLAAHATLATGTTGAPSAAAIEADSVEFRITVHEDASARWTFTYRRVLENETERRQFEAFAEEFEANETESYRNFVQLATGLTAEGRNATGRDMRATDFSRSAGLGGTCVTQDCGTISMGFTWTEFAVREGERLVIGDVFGTGLYISPDMELVVEAGDGLDFEAASPETYNDPDVPLAERDSITYRGEMTFADRRPRAVFVPAADESATTGTVATTNPGTGATATGSLGGGLPLALLGALVVLLGAAAAFAWWRSDGAGAVIPGDGPDDDGGVGGEAVGVADQPAIADEELLTDEDRVLSLLEDNGGRMKQVAIVEETGWSKSKVSMLLSEMEDDDQISKLRVGRENIISLAGHEPEAAGSPHEEN